MKFLSPIDVDGYISLITQNPGVTPTKFLIQDANGRIAFRTGQELKVDIGADYTSVLKHQVKAGVSINKGQAVYVTGADGTNMVVGLASNISEATSSKTMGLLDATVAINGFANVVTEGLLDGLNTSTANAGDSVWLGTNGNLIYGLANKPSAPDHLVFIGIVTRVNANNGEIFVKVQNGFELNEIHDVDLKSTAPSGNDILAFEGAPVNLWKNKSIAAVLGYTPYNASNPAGYISSYTETDPTVPSHVKSITTTEKSNWNTAFGWGNHASAGYATSGHTHIISPVAESSVSPNGISIQAGPGSSNPQGWTYPYGTKLSAISGAGRSFEIMSTTYPDGQLVLRTLGSSGVWDSWKTILDTSNYSTYSVPTSRTITINGTSYDLSANRSWTVSGTDNTKWPLEGSWKPASLASSTRLRGATSPDGGEFGLAYSGGQIHPYTDGFFYQNEGAYRVLDTSSYSAYSNFSGAVYGTIFYDSNNTGYYLDPASTSNLNALTVNGTLNGSGTNAFSRRVDLGSCNDYGYYVIKLIRLGGLGASDSSYSSGKISAARSNGLYTPSTVHFTLQKQYNSTGFFSNLNTVGTNAFEVCTFTHNGILWAGLRLIPSAAQYGWVIIDDLESIGYATTELIQYYDSRGTVNNSEINNSITLTNGSTADTTIKTGNLYVPAQVIASSFADSDDTGYYADFASTSQSAIRQRGGTLHGPNTTWGAYLLVGGNGRTGYIDNTTVASVVATDGNIHLDAASGKSMYLNWYDGGALIFGNGAESQIGYMSSAGDFTANSSSRAPIFYDSNNTGYYVDPASNTNLNTGTFNGRLKISDYIVCNGPGGMMGDYNVNSTNAKCIWTIGESWPLANMYGLAYEYNNSYYHHLALKENGTTYARLGFGPQGAYFTGTLTSGADVVAYSDRRLKDNIQTIENALDKVLSLRGVTYTRNDKEDKSQKVGVIAQEVQEILPQVVFEQEDGILGVSYGNITAVLIEAIKEQQTQIEELKQLVNQLINK